MDIERHLVPIQPFLSMRKQQDDDSNLDNLLTQPCWNLDMDVQIKCYGLYTPVYSKH